jgi:hypothetical protein
MWYNTKHSELPVDLLAAYCSTDQAYAKKLLHPIEINSK